MYMERITSPEGGLAYLVTLSPDEHNTFIDCAPVASDCARESGDWAEQDIRALGGAAVQFEECRTKPTHIHVMSYEDIRQMNIVMGLARLSGRQPVAQRASKLARTFRRSSLATKTTRYWG